MNKISEKKSLEKSTAMKAQFTNSIFAFFLFAIIIGCNKERMASKDSPNNAPLTPTGPGGWRIGVEAYDALEAEIDSADRFIEWKALRRDLYMSNVDSFKGHSLRIEFKQFPPNLHKYGDTAFYNIEETITNDNAMKVTFFKNERDTVREYTIKQGNQLAKLFLRSQLGSTFADTVYTLRFVLQDSYLLFADSSQQEFNCYLDINN